LRKTSASWQIRHRRAHLQKDRHKHSGNRV
jgi:hypothetical protein